MIFGSVCSGIEAASVAWHQLGWRAAFVSEIDPFPRAVLAHHYPDVPLHGDFTTIREGDYEAINVLVGGTPCQSFSIAGLRAGLDDDRGNLALEFCRLARRLEPRWVVWENVPGVLSLDGGRAFASILGGLAECGYGLAYRVLDAQFVRVDGFGRAVPQRRRRVFVVGCLGDWRCAAAVLFERQSLSRDTAPRRQAGQGAAPNLAARTRGGGGLGTDFDCDGGLVAKTVQATHKGHRDDPSADTFVTVAHTLNGKGGAGRSDIESETFLPVAHALCVDGFDASEDGTGRGTPIVPVAQGVALRGREEGATAELTGDVMTALRCGGGGGDKAHVLSPTICFSAKDHGADVLSDLSPTLRAGGFDKSHANASVMPAVMYRREMPNAYASQTNAGALLRRVRDEIGAEAFAEWGLGVLDTLQPAEILRSALHGRELRPATFSRRWVVHCALSREEGRTQGAMQSMREAAGERCTPQGRQPSQQLARELGAYLSELPQPGAQAERFMHDLWIASEGLGVLREALSEVQKARRPACGEGQSALSRWRVRRLIVEECEFLQGFPRGYTAIPYRRKIAADGPRYKALGNSMAVNVMRWIGTRIQAVENISGGQS